MHPTVEGSTIERALSVSGSVAVVVASSTVGWDAPLQSRSSSPHGCRLSPSERQTVDALSMTIDDRDASRIHLRGDPAGSDVEAFVDAAGTVLGGCPSHLIVDISGVTSAGPTLVEILNDLAGRATLLRKSVVVEVADDVADWLDSAALSSAIRVEHTRPLQVVTTHGRSAPSPAATTADGVSRCEGRGYVASYGQERRCAATDCGTTLSRYNSDALCSLHSEDDDRRRR